MTSGQIKASAQGYYLQHGDAGLKNYLEREVEGENLTFHEAENIYKEFTGREEVFERGKKETVKTIETENGTQVKMATPKNVEVIKEPQPAVSLTKEEKEWYSEGYKRRERNVPADTKEADITDDVTYKGTIYSEGYKRRETNVPAEPKETKITKDDVSKKNDAYRDKYAGMSYDEMGNKAAKLEAEFLIGEKDEIDYDEINWLRQESRDNAPDTVKEEYAKRESAYAEKRYKDAYDKLYGDGEIAGQNSYLNYWIGIHPEAFSYETDESRNIIGIKVDITKINGSDETKSAIKKASEEVSPWLKRMNEEKARIESSAAEAGAYGDSAKYTERDYDSTVAINYRIADLHQKANNNLYEYIVTGDESYLNAAESYLKTANEMAEKNSDVIAPDSWFEDIISSNVAQFPQYKHQIGQNIGIYITGGIAQIYHLPGLGTAHMIAGAKHGYEQIMGSAFYDLIKMGLDFGVAKELASSEAILGSVLEMGDSALDILGIGAGKTVAKGSASAIKKGIKILKTYAANVGGEGVEEGIQASIAMARNRLAEKILAGELKPEDINVVTLVEEVIAHKYSRDEVKEIGSSALEGVKGSLIISGVPIAIGGVAGKLRESSLKSTRTENTQTENSRTENPTSYSEVVEDVIKGENTPQVNPKSYSEVVEDIIKSENGTDIGQIYKTVITNSDKSTLTMVKDMSPAERVYFKAGAEGLSPTDASIRAEGIKIDHKKAWEAWEKGNIEFKKGNGNISEFLIDAADYFERNGDSEILSDFDGKMDIDKEIQEEYNRKQRDADIQRFVDGEKTFEEVQQAYASLYADLVKSNENWSWDEDVNGGHKLTRKMKHDIKEFAIKATLIVKVAIKTMKDTDYKIADFLSAGLVIKEIKLPEEMWKLTDWRQFSWLNSQIGGRIPGYTWHHSERDGVMQLVPRGIHRITSHNGGRSPGMWAYRGKKR